MNSGPARRVTFTLERDEETDSAKRGPKSQWICEKQQEIAEQTQTGVTEKGTGKKGKTGTIEEGNTPPQKQLKKSGVESQSVKTSKQVGGYRK